MRKALLMLLVTLTAGWVNLIKAQNSSESEIIRCYTMETDAMLRAQQPELGTLDDFERWLAPLVEDYKAQAASNERVNAVTTIPIIFHVIHNGEAVGTGDNISNALINAQIIQLNNDFRKISGTSGSNSNPVGADTEIEFCAATLDPNGATLATAGVNRINRNTKGWTAPPYGTCNGQNFSDAYIENTVKPQSQWDPTKYLNIWVMDVTCGILGYAQFPSSSGLSGLSSNGGAASTDGVVVIPSSIGSTTNPNGSGSYNKGRTLTHEIGHWVGLRHIWGDGGCSVDDFCNDTPTSDGANYGCPNTSSCGSTDMVQNYMDYTDDDCMNIYTADQKARMQAVLQNSPRRNTLGASAQCGGSTGGGGCSSTVSNFPYNESFEGGFGAWSQGSGDDINWSRISGSTPSSNTGPTGANAGTFYAYIEASSPNYPSKRAYLDGPCFDLPAASATMTFDYHMWGAAMGTLTLEASTDNGASWASVWSRSGNQGNAWSSASVSLAAYAGNSVQLRFNGITSNNYTSDMSIDDLSITTGSTGGGGCSNGITSFPYTEGFESSFGQWTQGAGDDFDWTRRSGGTPSSNTGPSSAASGSFYAYTESSSPNYSNKAAVLNSPCFNLSSLSAATFAFEYHMYGAAAMGGMVLEASSNGTTWNAVWSESGNQGNSWQSASVNLNAYAGQSSVQLRFVGTTGTTWQGDMAIDDVSLSGGGSSGGCNTVNITLTFDDYPEETSWQILDGSTVVASGGTYGSQADGSTIALSECIADGCYTFVINDAYGDGICCTYGNGSYLVTNSSSTVLASGGSFTSSESTNFCVSGGNRSELANLPAEGLSIFPNPVAERLNFMYDSKTSDNGVLRIADMTGRIVHVENVSLQAGMNQGAVSVNELAAGSYMLSISTKDALLTKRFIVTQ